MTESRVPFLTTWAEKAVCKGLVHIFYPDFSERPAKRERREKTAKMICNTCPVIEECRAYARANAEYGIWGGETEDERFLLGFPVPTTLRSEVKRRSKLKQEYERINNVNS